MKKSIYLNTEIDFKKITDTLDLFIQETLSEFIIFNSKYTSRANISEELADQMPKELSYMVLSRLSEGMKEQLCLIYNEEKINEVVTRRCISSCIIFIKDYNNNNNGNTNTISIL